MSLLALGINHKTAPVSVRERVSFAPEKLPHALQNLLERPEIEEAAILSTCNRTELYCTMDAIDTRPIAHWLGGFHEISPDEITPYLYTHPDQDAVRHMLRVASGLDSLVLGEPQILGQMKTAYQAANDAGTLGTRLNRLFQHTFSVAKQVRTDTAIGASAVSVAFAAVSLAKQIFGNIKNNTALLIGAGETIELAARHLHEQGVGRIIIANRTVEKAHTLAVQFGGYAIALSEIPDHLAEADIVISSTGSQLPILGKGAVERALKARKHQLMFMVDIAVPRDIEPEVGELDDIYLYTVDDLHEVIEENLKSRREAAEQAEEIIDTQVHRFMEWLRSQKSNRIIREYRGQAEIIQAEVHAKAMSMLESGKAPEQALEFLARTLTNKLIHAPTCAMKQASADGRGELLDAARELLNLDEKNQQ